MALFQATNIYPDMKGGVKNGVVLIPSGSVTVSTVDVSWSVNGNSRMTAYKIDFYQNTAASAFTGSTGKITLGSPFAAISADGTENRFTATVDFSLFSGAYAGTGTLQGKFKITMWWGSGADDYVEQRSLSVFEVSKAGSLSIIGQAGIGGDVAFTGLYIPPLSSVYGTVPLNWTRWEIYPGTVGGEPLQDTGKVWGATEYEWEPDTLAPGRYAVRFSAEQVNGAEIFAVEYADILQSDVTTVTGLLSVGCAGSNGAVKIRFTPEDIITPIPGSGSDTFFIPGEMFSGNPWHLIWLGTLTEDTPLFTIQCKDGTSVTAQYNSGSQDFTFSPPGTDTGGQYDVHIGDEVVICLTTGNFSAGTDTGFQWTIHDTIGQGVGDFAVNGTYAQSEIVSITIYNNAATSSFTVGFGTNNNEIKAGYDDPTKGAIFEGPKVHYPDGYGHATALYLGASQSVQALFRKETDQSGLTFIGNFESLGEDYITELLDYSAVNGKSYQYLVLENGESGGNAAISYSEAVTPCFTNWLLVEAEPKNSGWAGKNQSYEAVRAFLFTGNVNYGSYSNGSGRNIQPSFTPYPVVMRSTQNRRQGTLTGLIGSVENGAYSDSNETEAALRALSSSRNALFLRNRRGDFIKVALAGEISMTVNSGSAKQEVTVNLPWVETGPADSTGVFGLNYVEQVEPGPG